MSSGLSVSTGLDRNAIHASLKGEIDRSLSNLSRGGGISKDQREAMLRGVEALMRIEREEGRTALKEGTTSYDDKGNKKESFRPTFYGLLSEVKNDLCNKKPYAMQVGKIDEPGEQNSRQLVLLRDALVLKAPRVSRESEWRKRTRGVVKEVRERAKELYGIEE